jgi:ectoine hydroxylase-related dioxygenase (phytanoyl-CoA dioxygenase family)
MNAAQLHADRIRINGYTIIPDLLPRPKITELRDAFLRQLYELAEREPFNRGVNRYQMYLPFVPPFADPEVYENERVMEVVEAVFGGPSICPYFASDTPLPGADYQRVHSDTQILFPENRLSLPAYGLVLNIPLADVTEENGPMEIWPGGTHLWAGDGDMQALAEEMESVRVTMPAGSVLLRDLRMWHRGTPNPSDQARPNMALVYTRPWYRFELKPPVISRAAWEGLSERAQKIFRYAIVE